VNRLLIVYLASRNRQGDGQETNVRDWRVALTLDPIYLQMAAPHTVFLKDDIQWRNKAHSL